MKTIKVNCTGLEPEIYKVEENDFKNVYNIMILWLVSNISAMNLKELKCISGVDFIYFNGKLDNKEVNAMINYY